MEFLVGRDHTRKLNNIMKIEAEKKNSEESWKFRENKKRNVQ